MSGNLIREFAAANNFPYESLSSNVIIQSGFINNPGSTTYYWFYNWEVSTGSGCTNPIMVPVSAIVETPICYFVTDVQVDTVTQDYAAIEWMAGGSELQWEIEYGYAGFTQGMGTVQTANATTDTIFGLDHSTHYEFYVRGFCDPNYSAWNGPHSFLTLCGLFTLPFNEDFTGIANGDIPLCWDRTHLNWGVSNSDNAGSTAPEMRFNWSPSTTDTLMVITPEIDATTATSLYLSFMHTVDHYSFGDPYAIGVLASIDAGITWDSLWAVIPTADIDEELVNIDLSAYAGETIHIAWAFAGYTFDINNWYFDNVVIDEISPCVAPSALLADNIEAFAAELSWTGGIDTWEIEWDTTGFTLGTGYSIVTNDNPYILSGLTPETAYDFYVRSYCLFDTTAWEGPVTFSTIATCVAPDSLTAYNITHTTADLMWYSTDTIWQIQWDTAGFVPGTGIFVTTEDNPYALTGLTPSTDYEFWVRAICDTVLGDTSYWTGPFLFTTLDPCFSPINLIVNNVGLDFAELAWTAVGIETEWQIEWDTLGFTPGTGNVITTSDNPYTLTGLDDQTQYEFYVRAICDSLINDTSAWVGPESFTTLGVGITALQSGIGVELYPNPTNGNFNIKTLFDADKLTLTVMNIQGQVIHEEQLNGLTKGSVTEMNLTGFAAGIYYIRLNDGKSILNKKLIIN